jgi:molecular chaperone DnaK (HSP70)
MSSKPASPRYLVGIDLGTTHTVVAYADAGDPSRIELFPVEQLVAPGQVAERPLLPSVRYHPAEGELADADNTLPWPVDELAPGCRPLIGELARQLGSRSRGRLVASAKSWLCHAGVDRTAAILPWGAPDTVPKVPPVEASASFLLHVRQAWNRRFPDHPLEAQEVTVTIPASFDDAARALTVEAARQAGLARIRLLEEPQAACYDFLWTHRGRLTETLEGVSLLLVCDVGGGTTDFTLIRIGAGEPEPKLERIAVGNHLMLGGDNIDLTLAHRLEPRLTGAERSLSSTDLILLAEQCRAAKEQLLAEQGPEAVTVTLLGKGGGLIGGARSVELSRHEVLEVVLDGFFPQVEAGAVPERRSGVVEFGLPYASDPAITRHAAAFLALHRSETGTAMPDGLLFNGGAFHSPVIAGRMAEVVGSWTGRAPVLLRNQRPDQAVAFGAVAYGLARRGLAVQRIESGSARSYYLLIGDGGSGARRGVCLLPRGAGEGREWAVEQRHFLLSVGQPVRFHVFSSTVDSGHAPGDLVALEEGVFGELPPLAVAFEGGEAEEVEVRLAARLTEIGTLQLQCMAVGDAERRWNVELQLRPGAARPSMPPGFNPRAAEALEHVALIFGKKTRQLDPKAVRTLRNDLEKILGKREDWDTALCRELFAALLTGAPHRRRSADHERLWLSLAGYCLRPGFGAPLDDWRVGQVWNLYSQGLQFVNEAQNWSEWWILWRRVAGGLDAQAQQRIFADIAGFIDPVRARRGNAETLAKKRGFEDMLRLAASLERLSPGDKAMLGGWLIQRLDKAPDSAELWWALGRVGARAPFHGSAHSLVGREIVEGWVEQALRRDWKKQSFIAFAATMLARLTGDRERDLDAVLRNRVAEKLAASRLPESWLELVRVVKALDAADEKRIFGEGLPPGLRLVE